MRIMLPVLLLLSIGCIDEIDVGAPPVVYRPMELVRGPYVTQVDANNALFYFELLNPAREMKLSYVTTDDSDTIKMAPGRTNYLIKIHKLQPGSRYQYTFIADDMLVKGVFYTPPKDAEQFRFGVYGDTQENPSKHEVVADALAEERPEFVLHTGDLCDDGAQLESWQTQFFGPAEELLRNTVFFPAIGNHEKESPYLSEFFNLDPQKGWYTFTWGNAQFFALNTGAEFGSESEQYKWFESELAKSKATWRIVFQHQSGVSSGKGGFNRSINKYLRPLYEKYGVDVVFAGHDHSYERTKPIASPGGKPVVYVITGGGGGPLYAPDRTRYNVATAAVWHYVIVNVSRDRLTVRASTPEGELIDNFSIDKVIFEEVD